MYVAIVVVNVVTLSTYQRKEAVTLYYQACRSSDITYNISKSLTVTIPVIFSISYQLNFSIKYTVLIFFFLFSKMCFSFCRNE